MVDRYDIAQKLYDYELDRKEKINARLPFPVTVAVAMIAWGIWLFTIVDKRDGLPSGVFEFGVIGGGATLIAAVVSLAFSTVHREYMTLGTYENFLDNLRKSKGASVEKFATEQYAIAQKRNIRINLIREFCINTALRLLAVTAICLLAATAWLVSDGGHFAAAADLSVQIKNNPLTVHVDNLASSPAPSCNISIPPTLSPPIIHHGPHHHNPVPCLRDTVNPAARKPPMPISP